MSRYISQRHAKPSQRLWSLALLGTVVLGVVSEQGAIAQTQPSRPLIAQVNSRQPQTADVRLPNAVARRVRRELSQRFNIPRRSLTVVNFSQETWPDRCLGLAAPNERCMGGTVDGWRVELTNGQQNWVYRTDQQAQVIRLEPALTQQSPLLPDVENRLLLTVAEEVNVPVAMLRITDTQPATWDGCMGIFVPGQMCTRIAISGYRVVITGEGQSWVYHISETGDRIVQNSTASGSRGVVVASFIPTDALPQGTVGATVVFRIEQSGGLAGIVNETVLGSDGTIYQRSWRPGTTEAADPVVVKRLTPAQLQQFEQLLVQQRFQNLDKMRYLTDAVLADYPTTTIQSRGATVQYVDLEKDNLPEALRSVIQAWEQLN